jgi:hypothetical protein
MQGGMEEKTALAKQYKLRLPNQPRLPGIKHFAKVAVQTTSVHLV